MRFPPARPHAILLAALAFAAPVRAQGQDAPAAEAAPSAPAPAAPAPQQVEAMPSLDPGSPLAPLPDLGLDWPDLGAAPATSGPAAAGPGKPAAAIQVGRTQHYTTLITGLDDVGKDDPARGDEAASLRTRFNALSTLRKDRSEPANVAQIDRRARDDAQLLADLLRSDGYYDAAVDTRLEPAGAVIAVTLAAVPGILYHFGSVAVTGLDKAGGEQARLLASFPVKAGDPVDAGKVQAAQAALVIELGRRGFAFATVPDPEVVVDHASHLAALRLTVQTGVGGRFGAITVEGKSPFSAAHVAQIARFKPGDPYDAALLEDLRRALVATGLVSVARLTPRPGPTTGTVDIFAHIDPAPPRTVAAEIGYGTGQGAQVQLSWQHRNLLPPEGALTLSGILGTREQSAGVLLRRSDFHARDQVLTGQLTADHSDLDPYNAKTLIASIGLERQTNIIWQKKWTWSFGLEFSASDEKALPGVSAPDFVRQTYLVGAIPLTLGYDGTDDLLNPSRSFRIAIRLSPEANFEHETDGYGRAQIDLSGYQPVGDRIVLAGRIRLGSIFGAPLAEIAPSRRLYSGGGGSVRGYGYEDIGPRGTDNTPVGGRSLAEFGSEIRFKLGNFGIVPFFDGGNIYGGSLPKFTGLRYGTGLGVRYYTSFGPIRFDVGTPINPQPGDSRVAVYVSLGQAF